MIDISQALKCSVCGKYIIDNEELHSYNTCSKDCCEKVYQHNYYLNVTKPKRRIKKNGK